MIKKLILVEGKEDVKKLKLEMTSETKIICFDFEAHKDLDNLNIKHGKVEEYFSNNDELEIDNKANHLTTEWYRHTGLKKEIEYKGINLGNLLEIELISYFFDHIKRIFGIKRILEKEKTNEVIVSFLGNYASSHFINRGSDSGPLNNYA